MRGTAILGSKYVIKNGRRPGREPVPFKELLPLRLRDSVSGKGERTSDVACLQEMSVLFVCLKEHEFNQSLCNKEISSFQNCYKTFLGSKSERKHKDKMGIISPGSKNLTSKQVNQFFKQYPIQ